MAGVYGNPFPVNIDDPRRSTQWKTAGSMGLLAAMWSIIALSGTLAGEARRGSLEFVATTPLGMRRIALEKLFAHLTGMAIVVLVARSARTSPARSARCRATPSHGTGASGSPRGSASSPSRRAPSPGRSRRCSAAGRRPRSPAAVLLIGYFANGYREAVPAFAPLRRPDLVRLDGRTTSRWPASSTGRRSCPARSSPIVLFARRRRACSPGATSGRRAGSRGPACRPALLGLGGPPGARWASGSRRPSGGGSASGSWASSSARRRPRSPGAGAALARDARDLRADLPVRRPAVRRRGVPPARLHHVRVHPRGLRRVDAGRRLGVRRERGPARDAAVDADVADPVGDPRRARACTPRSACSRRS